MPLFGGDFEIRIGGGFSGLGGMRTGNDSRRASLLALTARG